ncbi:putative ABC transport system permease protein [Anaerovirgula multivorans]|uniref:Putative ABC transport system permease protein n=1 Tax=Anaerovirgula multivorans TaxID=312168 RepID=A0A239GQ95_9FIRM|nr:FtsX-like permease family protein [Anaerovirgula multivorans]SNS70958.1 putative ABC transport system permease protein [Anaerovirgula multivorans]
MCAKLVIRNIKRCFGDYVVYLLTLFFAVAIFYIFNAIPFSEGVQSSSREIRETMPIFINALSVFISVILGFLIVYANSFIIKKRSKELAIYMLLGMSARKISVMLFLEMLILAAAALLSGLFAGIFLSQGMSFIVARIFEQELEALKFSVSISSLIKTVFFFLLIFIVVAAFCSYKIACLKIINLLQTGKKNEKIRFAKTGISITLFAFSAMLLVAAYIIALGKDFRFNDVKKVISAFILGSAGTYLFYFSASGFLLTVLTRDKKLYYKKLNIFSLRQVSNKIMTNTVLIATISIMLLVTVCAFAGGFGLNDFANNKLKRASPNDFEFSTPINTDIALIGEYIKSEGYDKSLITEVEVYPSGATLSDTVLEQALEAASKENANAYSNLINMKLELVKLTDYNHLRRQKGLDSISLDKGAIALHVIESELKPYVKDFVDVNKALIIDGTTRKIAGVYDENLVAGYLEFAVINDEELAAVVPANKVVTVNINGKYDEAFSQKVTNEINKYKNGLLIVRFEILQKLYGMSALAIFAGLYIGITFLIMSTTVLALQQLTDAAQHRQRYKTLKEIGVDDKMIDDSIFLQMAVYFFTPLLLTIGNSAVALTAITNYIQLAGNFSIFKMVLFTVMVFTVFYGVYFTACKRGFKRILEGQGY